MTRARVPALSVAASGASMRWQLVVAVLLAGSAWFVWSGKSEADRAASFVPVPLVLGGWTGRAVEVTQRTIDILETEDVELKEYGQGDQPPVWLARVTGIGTRAAFHPPELCYVGSNFEVLERGRIILTVGGTPQQVMRLLVGQGGTTFEAWYWFTANGRVTPSYYRQQAWLLFDSIRQRPISGTLVRISTILDDPERARARLLSFMESFNAHAASAQTVS